MKENCKNMKTKYTHNKSLNQTAKKTPLVNSTLDFLGYINMKTPVISSERSIIELNLISCQKCGAPIITIGNNMHVVIPSLNFKCLTCGTYGIFDKIYGDTSESNSVLQPVIKADVECPACNRWKQEFGGANFCANCGRKIRTA
uniref:Uncharacterized protein n=2 Tax=viral metagenome TaxID=1070528 RepID=A0A6M3K9H2_9ZZZZ